MKDVDLKAGKFEIYNENFFKTLDDLQLDWFVGGASNHQHESAGRPAGMTFGHGGTIDISGIQPQQRKVIISEELRQTVERVLGHHNDNELFVIFQFKSKVAQPLIDKGQVMARQQFCINDYKFPSLEPATAKVQKEETNSYVKFEAAGTTMTVGKWSGWIDYLDVDGQPMLIDRESITSEFWRAPTDNDYGAQLQNRFGVWKNPEMRVASVNVSDNSAVATIELREPEARQPWVQRPRGERRPPFATLTMTYTLTDEGQVVIRQQMTVNKESKMSQLFRYGVQLQMPKQYNAVEYYGRGPIENYCDRNASEFIGIYNNKVKDEYYPYVRPQESGNHTDVRWFRVLNAEGRGLEFYSNAPMEASALNFLVADLDDGPHKDKKWGRHSGDLVERPLTQVHLQQKQFGLGCVNSWGAWPRGEYQLPFQDYDFTVAIKPMR